MYIARPIRRPENHPLERCHRAVTAATLALFGLIGLGVSLWLTLHAGPLPCVEDPAFVLDMPP